MVCVLYIKLYVCAHMYIPCVTHKQLVLSDSINIVIIVVVELLSR